MWQPDERFTPRSRRGYSTLHSISLTTYIECVCKVNGIDGASSGIVPEYHTDLLQRDMTVSASACCAINLINLYEH